MAYSTERRAAVLKKLEPPNAVPLRQLAKDEGISEATLHAWRRDARSKGRLLPDAEAGPEGWTSRDKFAAVLETAALNEADLAASTLIDARKACMGQVLVQPVPP